VRLDICGALQLLGAQGERWLRGEAHGETRGWHRIQRTTSVASGWAGPWRNIRGVVAVSCIVCNRRIFIVVVVVFSVRVLQDLVTHIGELDVRGFGRGRRASAGPCVVLPDTPLGVYLGGPFLHGLLRSEADNEVFYSRIAFPENLARIGAWGND
jgi:hypothetical protein